MGKGSKGTMGNKEVCGIYGYYDNLKDKIIYVGQSKHIYLRHKIHIHSSYYADQQINKVLQNNPLRYDLVILKECSVDELNHWEITLIALFNPQFNFTNGGYGIRGFKHSKETIKKLREASTGRKHTLESRRKISEANKGKNNPFWGKKLTEEHRKHLKEAHKKHPPVRYWLGKKRSKETNEKIRKANLGRKFTEEHKRKISEGNKGKTMSDTAKQKLRVANLGKKHSEETKQKIRDANLKRYPHIHKAYNKNGKDVYRIYYMGWNVKQSNNKEKLEKFLNEYWDAIIDGSLKNNPPKKQPKIVKNGISKNGKQTYCILYKHKMIKISVYKDKLEQYLKEHYDEIVDSM